MPGKRNFSQPLWLGGEDIARKTILLHAEQGFGDTIQFVRYVPLVAKTNDFVDTAVLVSSMSLVITVDTSLAHLAGSIGRPTWVLLPFSPAWRWQLDGATLYFSFTPRGAVFPYQIDDR